MFSVANAFAIVQWQIQPAELTNVLSGGHLIALIIVAIMSIRKSGIFNVFLLIWRVE